MRLMGTGDSLECSIKENCDSIHDASNSIENERLKTLKYSGEN